MKKFYFIFLMIMVMLGSLNLKAQDNKNNGKVVGQIVDEITGQPVNCIFAIKFFKKGSVDSFQPADSDTLSDKDGKFKFKIKPGEYGIWVIPLPLLSLNSVCNCKGKYARSFLWGKNDNVPYINIESRKINKVIVPVKRAGDLKIELVDQNGTKLEKVPRILFEIFSEDKWQPGNYSSRGILHVYGEVLIRRLLPGKYMLFLEGDGSGFGSKLHRNIEVKIGETTVHKAVFDPNDSSGVTGVVKYSNGDFAKGARVSVVKQGELFDGLDRAHSASIVVGDNGVYRLIGLQKGKYILSCYIMNEMGIFKTKQVIIIDSDHTKKLDLIL